MENKIKIVADSTCDLLPELIERYGIEIIPLPVNLGDRPYLDGVDVFPQDLFDYTKSTGKLPTTSAPTPAYYEDFYRSWTQDGFSVVHFSISLAFTVTHNIARMAAENYPNVYPVDSRNISSGMGILAIRAAQMRDEGLSAAEIAERSRALTDKVQTSFVLDTLEYMYKGGRCTGVQALGANLLNLKPCIEVKDGAMGVTRKYRGNLGSVLEQFIENKLKDRTELDLSMVMITQCYTEPELLTRVTNKIKELQPFKEVIVNPTGCSVSVHCGPNTVGLIFMTK